MTRRRLRKAAERVVTTPVLHAFVLVTWLTFVCGRALLPRFRRAVSGSDAVYQFRSATATRRLVIADGHISTRSGGCKSPDYEITFVDLPGALRHLLRDPNDVLGLLVENKISQRGNTYYLFRFGYLLGLIEASARKWISNGRLRQAADSARHT